MRAFGLVGLLVVVAIMLIVWTQNTSQVAKVHKDVRPQVEQLAGRDSSGAAVSGTYELEEVTEGGTFRGLRVKSIDANSAMKSFYGLEQGDVIIEFAQRGGVTTKARDSDPESMKAFIAEAYQFQQPLIVTRGGHTLTLKPGNAHPRTDNAPDNSVSNQLDKITKPR